MAAESGAAWHIVKRYGVALLACAAGLVLRAAVGPLLGSTGAFSTLYPAVVAAGWYGGFGPGVLATFVSAAAAVHFILEPASSFGALTVADVTIVAIFVISGLFVSWLNHELHEALRLTETAEKNERRQRTWWLQTVSSIGDAVITTDNQAKVEFMNPVAEALTGWTTAEAKGRSLDQVINVAAGDSGLPAETPVKRVLETGVVQGLATRTVLVRRDGTRVPIADKAAPIRTAAGSIAGVVMVLRDVSEARHAREQLIATLESLRLALQASRMGTWSRDLQSGAVQWSPELEALFGFQAGSFSGSREQFLSLIHPDDRPRYVEAINESIASRTDYTVEFRFFRPDGEVRWMEGRGRAFYDDSGQPLRMMGIGIDVTERKRAEEALRRANEELEQFAFAASHDLKEPLRMVSMYLQLIHRRYAQVLDDDGKQFMEFARDGAHRMQQLIDSLLEYSHLSAVHPGSIAPISSDRVLENTLTDLRPALAESGARITRDPLPEVLADEIHLAQIFQNLLANAMKYRSASPPEIHVSARPGSGEWIFSVRDNGVGIEPEHHRKIFRIFQRLHGRDYPGTGVGLATCRRIVEKYGGRIWVESKPGQGSTFFFTLPDAPSKRGLDDAP
jgi:PAS domain S-box-containing protein